MNRTGHLLSRLAITNLLRMIEVARSDGVELVVSSAYHSFAYQSRLYRSCQQQLGMVALDRVLAQPSHSQHQLGTAVDVGSVEPGYGELVAGRWQARNARHFE